MKKIILSVAILATFLTACKKKKDDPAPATKSTTDYLTAHSWKASGAVTNVAVDYDDDASTPKTTDAWSQTDACAKSGVITLATNGTGTYAETCANPSTNNVKWTLVNSTLIVTILDSNGATSDMESFTVVSVDDNTLKLSFQAQDSDGTTYTETDTFSK